MTLLHTYLPQDRLRALTQGTTLPDRTHGTALFADISGFTALTERLTHELGPRRGIEELTLQINSVYAALIAEIERYGGSVISFAGDAITCWFDHDHGTHAAAAALALQDAMHAFPTLGLKIALTTGPARRFVIGDPSIQLLDTLAGATIARLTTAEHLTPTGAILADEATVNALAADATCATWHTADNGERFAVLTALHALPAESPHALPDDLRALDAQTLHAWVQPAVFERELSGHGAFLTELRPAGALFLRFTGIDYDADSAQAQLDAFIRQTQAVATRYDGTLLNLIIGDKGSYVYIALGALSAHEDDARRAVKAALALRTATATLGFLAPVQIGITYGTLRVGTYGGPTRTTYSALGDEVNLAARLMQAAAPGEILLSAHAQKLVAHDFTCEPRPPLMMKGKAEPLPVFAVADVRHERAIRLQEPGYILPMVGRTQELALIQAKLEMASDGTAQVIGIVAEAGMGKSRLVAEVIRTAHQLGFVGYGGACQSDALHTPYHAWKSVWQAFFDVDPAAPRHKQVRQLERQLADHAPERIKALPLLGILLTLDLPENSFTQNLEPRHRHSALRALLEDCLWTAAHAAPVLIVLEDLHWIDALARQLLAELARALPKSRICFVLTYRSPQGAHNPLASIEALPDFTQVALHELTASEAAQAIHAKLAQLYPTRSGNAPQELVAHLMARAQGNPFFLEELLNYLHDRGFDPREPDALEKIELPDSLHALILSRLDQLSEHERTTLRVASIIGRLFRAGWLAGYYPGLGAWSHIHRDLMRLSTLGITPLDSRAQSPQGETEWIYLFKHIVTHEVTYASLPYATRAQLHEQLARYLEDTYAEHPPLDDLAFHYGRSANHAKQREYWLKAGDTAYQTSAFHSAADYYTHTLALTPLDDAHYLPLLTRLSETQLSLGDVVTARTNLEAALAQPCGTPAERAIATSVLAQIQLNNGDYANAQQVLQDALPTARASGDLQALASVLITLGEVQNRVGQLDEAFVTLSEGLAVARAAGDVTREIYACVDLSNTFATQGVLERADEYLHEAYARATAIGNRKEAAIALNNLGEHAKMRQDYQQARALHQQALALAHEIGSQLYIAGFLINLTDDDIKLGDFAAARAGLRVGMTLALQLGTQPTIVTTLLYSGFLAHAEGQTDRALTLLGLARRHPAWSINSQQELDAELARWALDPAVVEAGLAQGAALDWDTTIQEIMRA